MTESRVDGKSGAARPMARRVIRIARGGDLSFGALPSGHVRAKGGAGDNGVAGGTALRDLRHLLQTATAIAQLARAARIPLT